MERDFTALKEDLQAQRRASEELRARLERVEARVELAARPAALRPSTALETAPVALKTRTFFDDLPVVRLSAPSSVPSIDTRIAVRDPTPEQLEELERPADLDTAVDASDPEAEGDFVAALRQYNAGQRLEAATAFEALATRYPRHAVTDNALYLAGMARVADGRCPDGVPFFERVVETFKDADAVAPSMLALAHCDAARGRKDRAVLLFERVVREFPRSLESTQAQAELAGLKAAAGR